MSDKPRLLMLTSSFPRSRDDETCGYVREWARSLSGDFAVTVLTFADAQATDAGANDADFVLRRAESLVPLAWNPLQAGEDLNALATKNLLTKLLAGISLLSFFIQALVLSRRADYLCSHWLAPAGLVGAMLSRLLGKPHLIVEHSGALHLLRRHPLGRWLARFIVRHADRVAVVSGDLQNKLIEICPQAKAKIRVLPMGVDIAALQILPVGAGFVPARLLRSKMNPCACGASRAGQAPCPYSLAPDDYPYSPAQMEIANASCSTGTGAGKATLLFIGRLVEIKGLDLLLQALGQSRELRLSTQLLVAGDGEERGALERLAQQLGVEARFLGAVGRREKAQLLSLCDAVVIPSRVLADGRSEGAPVVALEALAAGRAIIAARVGGLSEIIADGHNGLLFAAGDAESLAERLKQVLNDDALRRRLAAQARQSAHAYDWREVGARFAELLRE